MYREIIIRGDKYLNAVMVRWKYRRDLLWLVRRRWWSRNLG